MGGRERFFLRPIRTVLLHGYSDCSESFVDMKKFLRDEGLGLPDEIFFADYESCEDALTFNDVSDGLTDEFKRHGIIDANGKALCDLNVVVHSTGGLVIRQWIWKNYVDRGDVRDCPIKRIVMLAPANFGSPLAHQGKSLLGMLVKGRRKVGGLFEVGRKILDGLELASPYQWDLAHRDIVHVKEPYFRADRIQLTVLVGIEDYRGIKSIANKPGTDGTVVIAGTPLNSAKLTLDLTDPRSPPRWTQDKPPTDFAFGVLPDLDHGSIVDDVRSKSLVGEYLKRALTTSDVASFRALQADLETQTAHTYAATRAAAVARGDDDSRYAPFQQFVMRAVDDYDVPIQDYTVEFFVVRADRADDATVDDRNVTFSDEEEALSLRVQALLTSQAHRNTKDGSLRRFLVIPEKVESMLEEARTTLGGDVVLSLRVHVPSEEKGITYDVKALRNVVLHHTGKPAEVKLLCPNTTTLVELRVNRRSSYVTVGTDPQRR